MFTQMIMHLQAWMSTTTVEILLVVDDGREKKVVWCFAGLGQKKTHRIDCEVPKSPPLKVLDFSQDNAGQLDANNNSTYASLWVTNLPSSFTIRSAFMVDKWGEITNSVLFNLFINSGCLLYYLLLKAPQSCLVQDL